MFRKFSPRDIPDDHITGLPPREHFLNWVNEAVNAPLGVHPSAVVLIRIENLADINDQFGPDFGNHVLSTCAQRLIDAVGNGGQLARGLGPEFQLLIPKIDGIDLPQMSQTLLNLVREPVETGDIIAMPRAVVGGVLRQTPHRDGADLLATTRRALRDAQAGGLDLAVYVNDVKPPESISAQADDRLEEAFANNEFCLYYQPIVTPGEKNLIGFEALLRWIDPAGSADGMQMSLPGEFLHLVERSDLAVPIYRWVMEEACRSVQRWSKRIDRSLMVSINIAGSHLEEPKFADSVFAAINSSGLPAERLLLDITDQALKHNQDKTWSRLRRLKQEGIRIGLNDFGLGVSSLTTLRDVSVDAISIPRAFVAGLGISAEDEVIVRHMISLAHELGIVTVATGVEHLEQRTALTEMGCDLAQGFLFGRPERQSALDNLLPGRATAVKVV
ncbi:MAG: GGDEF domain-containing phosphodiesterase [Acidimicrobiales bacterium]